MNGRPFWRSADAAAAQVEKKYSRPSHHTPKEHTRDLEEGATSDQEGGVEEVEVRIGSDDGVVCQRGLETKQSSA